jgi:hypothetical protein
LLVSLRYGADGKRSEIVRPNGLSTIFLRDNAQRLESFSQNFSNPADSLENIFSYNPANQVVRLIQTNDQYNFREVANRTGWPDLSVPDTIYNTFTRSNSAGLM